VPEVFGRVRPGKDAISIIQIHGDWFTHTHKVIKCIPASGVNDIALKDDKVGRHYQVLNYRTQVLKKTGNMDQFPLPFIAGSVEG
jgi:hypothetical protein